MNQRRARAFRRKRAKELRRLATILQENELVRDVGPLLSAAGQCDSNRTYDELSWGYEFSGLEFNLDFSALRHSKPDGAELDVGELSVSLVGRCLDAGSHDDPFTNLSVNITVHGLSEEAEPLMAAWHLDKHQGGDSAFTHPNYHFHHGGKKIWEEQDFDYGSHLLLESPRLDHKPLDGILAVDFVLANFAGEAWQALKIDPSYSDLVREAEKRCHLAYAHAALDYLQNGVNIFYRFIRRSRR